RPPASRRLGERRDHAPVRRAPGHRPGTRRLRRGQPDGGPAVGGSVRFVCGRCGRLLARGVVQEMDDPYDPVEESVVAPWPYTTDSAPDHYGPNHDMPRGRVTATVNAWDPPSGRASLWEESFHF